MKNLMILAVTTVLLTSTLASAETIASCKANGVGVETLVISQGEAGAGLTSKLSRLYEGKVYEFNYQQVKSLTFKRDVNGSFGANNELVRYNLDLFIRMFGPKFNPEAVFSYTQYVINPEGDATSNFTVLKDANQKIVFSGFNFKAMPGKAFYRVCL